MTTPRHPKELDELMRQGISLRALGDGTYVEQRGLVPCARCRRVVPTLFGHPDAPVCQPCGRHILDEWACAHVEAARRDLGLAERTAPLPWYDRPVFFGWDLLVVYLFGLLLGMWLAAIEIGRALP